jgi:DNA polymerase-3 subunit alpha
VIIAEGKVDNSRGEPSVLVDNIKTEVKIDSEHLKKKIAPPEEERIEEPPPIEYAKQPVKVQKEMVKEDEPAAVVKPEVTAEAKVIAESETPNDNMPPEPEFPPDFIVYDDAGAEAVLEFEKGKPEKATPPATPEPVKAADEKSTYEVSSETGDEDEGEAEAPVDPPAKEKNSPVAPTAIGQGRAGASVQGQEEPVEDIKPVLPVMKPEKPVVDKRHDKKEMATIVMRSLGDKNRDILRMRRVYGMLISEPGEDRFAFYVIESERGYRLEFPNDTTDLTEDMLRRIEDLMGKENVIVEPITLQ